MGVERADARVRLRGPRSGPAVGVERLLRREAARVPAYGEAARDPARGEEALGPALGVAAHGPARGAAPPGPARVAGPGARGAADFATAPARFHTFTGIPNDLN